MQQYKGFSYDRGENDEWIIFLPNGYRRVLPSDEFANEDELKASIDAMLGG